MKSDVKAVLLEGGLKKGVDTKLQDYLNGDNDWNEAILEKDIIDVKYNTGAILLLHRSPTPKITG